MNGENLDTIAADAAKRDQQPGPSAPAAQPGEQPAPPPLSTGDAIEWARLPYTVGHILAVMLPELKKVYTETACMEWGTAMAAVAAKYNWRPPGPEVVAIAATLPLAIPTATEIKLWLDVRSKRLTPDQAAEVRGAGVAAAAAAAESMAGPVAPLGGEDAVPPEEQIKRHPKVAAVG